jgi:hypothetical protein
VDFDAKRQFLLDHVEKIIYNRYHVVIIGSVPVKPVGRETGSEPEHVRKLEYRIEGRIDTSKLHTRPRKKFAGMVFRFRFASCSAFGDPILRNTGSSEIN